MDKISVIVPCFNEEDVLPLFYKEVTHVLESIENIDYEILFINDGSHDHSEDILKLLAHKNPHCFYYSFSRNFGKEAAIYAGLHYATGTYLSIIDADLQQDPEIVKHMTEILEKKGLTATAGIGTNLYLCKIAMDIVAKHMEPDDNGVRIAELDEISYRELLWDHRPLTDFWRVGAGYRKKLEAAGMFTMGDVARCSIGGLGDYYNEDLLYRMFGINAELLIDHAWGYEPVTMDLIKSYRPETNCISSGQVLHCATDFMQAKIVVREMAEQLAMDLVEKKLVTDQIVLTVGYDIDNLKIPALETLMQ